MTQVATPESVVGDFNDAQVEVQGVRYRLFRDGDELFAEWNEVARGEASSDRLVRRRIVMTTGSHHDQMYWHVTEGKGRAVRQLPLDYSLRMDRWIPAQSSYLAPPTKPAKYRAGDWSRSCSRCHAVHTEPRTSGKQVDTRVSEFGIACEACHGPLEEHVRRNRNPLHRYSQYFGGGDDAAAINPTKLDSKRSAEVCGQCHGVWLTGEARDLYRPGMKIHQMRVAVRPRYFDPDYEPVDRADRNHQAAVLTAVSTAPGFIPGTYWSDGVLRVSGREYSGLLDSPCFERGELTCSSCHSMHRDDDDPRPLAEWRIDQLAPGTDGNEACTGCHPSLGGEQLVAHTRHEPESSGSLCYNCHMPFTVYGIQKAHRSHTVASPSADETLGTGRPNACNQCHLDRTLAWTAGWLERWYGLAPPLIEGDDAQVAAGALAALSGDAGQRALVAWSMGWGPAREASGADAEPDWMIPFLGQLLDDPYDAVRFVADLALRKRADYASFEYDFVGSRSNRRAAAKRTRESAHFLHGSTSGPDRAGVLLDAQGNLDLASFQRLLRNRDNRPVDLWE